MLRAKCGEHVLRVLIQLEGRTMRDLRRLVAITWAKLKALVREQLLVLLS